MFLVQGVREVQADGTLSEPMTIQIGTRENEITETATFAFEGEPEPDTTQRYAIVEEG